MAYCAAVILIYYLGLRFSGIRAVLVAGLPALMVVTMGISILLVAGLFLLAHRFQ